VEKEQQKKNDFVEKLEKLAQNLALLTAGE